MKRMNAENAETELELAIEAVEAGIEVLVLVDGEPIAKLVPARRGDAEGPPLNAASASAG